MIKSTRKTDLLDYCNYNGPTLRKSKKKNSASHKLADLSAYLECNGAPLRKHKKKKLASRIADNCDAAQSEDRVGDLPDSLIHRILSFMETKDAIQTCVLSKRWRYIWTSVPCLNLNSKSFSRLMDFKRFVMWVLSHRDSSDIKSLTYTRFGVDYATDQSLFNKVIEYATAHGVEEIRINLQGKSSGSPPVEIPVCLFACQSLKRLELKDCHPTNVPTTFGCKSLEVLHLEHFPVQPDPFSSIAELFGFTTLTTLHLDSFTLSCAGTVRLNPFANCVNLKNLHLRGISFKSDLNPKDFVISAPKLNNLILMCNRFKCKLVVAAPQLTNFSYFYSSQSAFFEFSLPSLNDLVIDIREVHDHFESSHPKHGLINVLRGHHNAEAVKLFFRTVEAACGIPALLNCEASPFSKSKSLSLGVGSTYKIFISKLDHIIAYFRNCSQPADFEIMTV